MASYTGGCGRALSKSIHGNERGAGGAGAGGGALRGEHRGRTGSVSSEVDSDNDDDAGLVLPPGWQAVEDDGYVYYYNSATGETVWTHPGKPAERDAGGAAGGAGTGSSDSDDDYELPPGWEAVEDDGYVYYYNSATGETVWTRPKAVAKDSSSPPPGTQVLVDPESGCPFWYNAATGEMKWLPADYSATDKDNNDLNLAVTPSNMRQMQKRMTMQHKRRTMMTGGSDAAAVDSATAHGHGAAPRKSILRTGEGLEVHFDPSTGRGYTHNEMTGELKWLTLDESQSLHRDGGDEGGADKKAGGGGGGNNKEEEEEEEESDDDEDGLRWAWVHAAGSISGWRTLDEFKSLFGAKWAPLWKAAEKDDVPSRDEFAKNLPWKEGKAQWHFYHDQSAGLNLDLDPHLMAGGKADTSRKDPELFDVRKEETAQFILDVKKEGIREGGTYRVSFNKWKGRFAKAWWMKVIKILPHDELILMKHPDTGKEYEKSLTQWMKIGVKAKG